MWVFVRFCVLICFCWNLPAAECRNQLLKEGESCKETIEGSQRCTLVKECPEAVEILMLNNGSQPEFCGFKGLEAMVCCKSKVNHTVGAKAREMCKKYADSVFIQLPNGLNGELIKYDTCAQKKDTTRSKRVVGGQESESREFPHMALIGFVRENDNRSKRWLCGGSLLSDRFVLTAGQCSMQHRDEYPKIVKLGDHNIESDTDEDKNAAQPSEYEIEQIFTHPEYKYPSAYDDIALLKLKTPVFFTEFIRPICLHTHNDLSKYALVTGWGRTDTGEPSDTLQTAMLTVSNYSDCYNDYKKFIGNKELKDGISEAKMVCALGSEGKDSCQGDSGGPLQVRLEEPYCMYSQVGITSFGVKCGLIPGVYTRVSYYIPWIESIVWPGPGTGSDIMF